MELFTLWGKWFWAICVVVTLMNVAVFRLRANREIKVHPELEEGYRTLLKGFAFWANVPWIVMGVGCVFGGVPSVYHFFRPFDGNPFVTAFFASVLFEWIIGTYWLVFRGGAQTIVNYPGLLNVNFKSPRTVLFLWFLCLAGGAFALINIFYRNVPIPSQ
jgi:hypothetical protein